MRRSIIVMGASMGGIQAVSAILQDLPKDLAAALLVAIHLSPTEPSILDSILNRSSPLPVLHPKDRQKIREGAVYLAPTDRHLLVEKDRVRVLRSPPENLHRPAIDPLFRSAAYYHRSRVAGVLLTGADSDGTAGLFSVKMRGGVTICQDPNEARAPVMPFTALKHVDIDHTLQLSAIGPLLTRLAGNGDHRR